MSESKRAALSDPGDAAGPVAPAPLPGGLYLVATPIGNAADITLRALDILRRADCLVAEDTRTLRKLMEIHGVPLSGRPLVSYHDRNGPARRPQIAGWLAEERSVAYASDAGTPLIADPGYRLVELAIEGDHPVTMAPGPAAAVVALALSGLPSDRFLFAGFPPPKGGARRTWLAEIAAVPATLVIYESPHRLADSLADMATVLGAGRPAALTRELTKRFEEVRRMPLGDLAADIAANGPPRGEIVLVIGPPTAEQAAEESAASLDATLAEALTRLHVKDAAKEVAERLNLPRREVYARALELKG